MGQKINTYALNYGTFVVNQKEMFVRQNSKIE